MYDGRHVGLGTLRSHIKQEKIDYPVLHDAGGRVAQEVGVRGYPTAFFAGSDGKVTWVGSLSGTSTRQTVEALIKREMRKSGKATDRTDTDRFRVVHPGRTSSGGMTGPVWIEFSDDGDSVSRATVVLPRPETNRALRRILDGDFPNPSQVMLRRSSSIDARFDVLRLMAKGDRTRLADGLRRALARVDSGILRRLNGRGVLRRQSQRSTGQEAGWVIVTQNGRKYLVDEPAAPLRRNGTRVFFRGRLLAADSRRLFDVESSVHSGAILKLESMAVRNQTPEALESGETKITPSIRDHARRLVAKGLEAKSRFTEPFPRGFVELVGPDFLVCPYTGEKLRTEDLVVAEKGIGKPVTLWHTRDDAP